MTQEEFNAMLQVAIAQGIGGGTYISRWSGEEIDDGVGKLLLPGGILTPDLADGAVTWPKLAPEARKSNPNLLDNWYFVGGGSQQGGGQFPINQRGLPKYEIKGYTIDRWRVFSDPMQVELTASGLQLTPINGALSYFAQKMDPSLYDSVQGEVATLSVLTDTNLFSGSFVFDATHRVDLDLGGGILFRCRGSDGEVSFMFPAGATTGVLVKAAKLELGPNQTLAYESAGGVEPN